MPSPNPLPANVKQLRGRHDGVDSGGRPIPEVPAFDRGQIPEKPDDLGPEGSKLWDLCIRDLVKLNLTKELDGEALHEMCLCVSRYHLAVKRYAEFGMVEDNPKTGMPHKSPWVTIAQDAAKEYLSWCSRFGLTPSDEIRLAKEAGEGSGKNSVSDAFPG